jgi:hypothetical protein
MKKKMMMAFLMAAISSTAIIAADGGDEKRLLGYWSFNDGAGEVVKDSSGGNHDGKILNNMRGVKWVDGKKGKALHFKGTRSGKDSGCVFVPKFKVDVTKGVTIEVWIKLDKGVDPEELFEIVGNMGGNYGPGFRLYYNWKELTFMSGPCKGPKEIWKVVTSKYSPIGKWLHLAATYDGEVYKLYVNGEEAATSKGKLPITNGNNFLSIGSFLKGVSYGFNGIIDEMKIYNYPLSSEDILKEAKF